MKKILVIVKNLSSGGAEKQSVLLAIALKNNYEVHYAVLNSKYQEPKYVRLLQESSTIHFIAFEGNLAVRFFKFCKYLKSNEIEFIFSYLTAANFLGWAAGRLTGTTKVFSGIRNAYLPPLKLKIDRYLCNSLVSKAILNCFSGKEYFSDNGFKNTKMIVIPNCFENITPYTTKEKTDDITRIISVGRFVEQKDYFTAIAVINEVRKKHSNVSYSIVGFGTLEDEIRLKVKELGLSKHIQIHLNPNNISELLDNSDIYLSTSLFEGTSNSIMEAMNSNLPIVATNVGDNNQLIKEDKNGFLCSVKDVKLLSDKICYLIENKVLRIEMGRESKQILLSNFSFSKFRKSYTDLIENNL